MKRCAEVALVEPVERSSDTYTALFATGFFWVFFKFFSDVTRVFCKGGEECKVEGQGRRMFQTFDVVF